MKQVSGYLSVDGLFFDTMKECNYHERAATLVAKIDASLFYGISINSDNILAMLALFQDEFNAYLDAQHSINLTIINEDIITIDEPNVADAPKETNKDQADDTAPKLKST